MGQPAGATPACVGSARVISPERLASVDALSDMGDIHLACVRNGKRVVAVSAAPGHELRKVGTMGRRGGITRAVCVCRSGLAAGPPLADGDNPVLVDALDDNEQAVEADGDADAEPVDLERQLEERAMDVEVGGEGDQCVLVQRDPFKGPQPEKS